MLKSLLFGTSLFLMGANTMAIDWDYEISSVMEMTQDSISVYNTGFSANAQTDGCISADFRGAVDGEVTQISSEDFDLGNFVQELSATCEIDMEHTALVLSVGKMPTGAQLDHNSPSQLGGVMGVRLSIEPKKLPLIQDWMDKHELRITKIAITRYDADSGDRLDLNDLTEADMTAYALYLSKGQNLHTFFIRKQPDSDNRFGVTSTTVGAAYILPRHKLSPQFFAMVHKSESDFLDLDLLVLSATVKIAPKSDYRATFTYTDATENKWGVESDVYDVSLSKAFKKKKKKHGWSIEGKVGVKVERGDVNDETIYARIEVKR